MDKRPMKKRRTKEKDHEETDCSDPSFFRFEILLNRNDFKCIHLANVNNL